MTPPVTSSKHSPTSSTIYVDEPLDCFGSRRKSDRGWISFKTNNYETFTVKYCRIKLAPSAPAPPGAVFVLRMLHVSGIYSWQNGNKLRVVDSSGRTQAIGLYNVGLHDSFEPVCFVVTDVTSRECEAEAKRLQSSDSCRVVGFKGADIGRGGLTLMADSKDLRFYAHYEFVRCGRPTSTTPVPRTTAAVAAVSPGQQRGDNLLFSTVTLSGR